MAKELKNALQRKEPGGSGLQTSMNEELHKLKNQLTEIQQMMASAQQLQGQELLPKPSGGLLTGAELKQQIAQFGSQIQKQQNQVIQRLQQSIRQGMQIMNETNQYFQAYQMLSQMRELMYQSEQSMQSPSAKPMQQPPSDGDSGSQQQQPVH